MSLLTPSPARHIDPRGMRFGAGVSAIVLAIAFLLNLPWLAVLVGVNLGLSAFFGTRLFLPSRPWPLRPPRAQARSAGRARARVPAALRAGARGDVPGPRGPRVPRRRHAARLAAGRRGRGPPDAARRDRDLRRLPAVLPALVRAVGVRAPVPANRCAPSARGAARSSASRSGSAVDGFEEPLSVRDDRGLRAIGRAELPDDVLHVLLDGVLGDRELAADLLVRQPLGEEPQDRGLARRQREVREPRLDALEAGRLGRRAQRLAQQVGPDGELAAGHRLDHRQHLARRRVLQQVAGGAASDGVEHVAPLVVGGDDDDGDRVLELLDLPEARQPVDARASGCRAARCPAAGR